MEQQLAERISELKLRRILELNAKLKESLLRERISTSNASRLSVSIFRFLVQC